MVEMASDPKISVSWLPPPAITAANSLTRCCGAWPPEVFQDGAGRAGGHPARHRPGVIVRTAQGCPCSRNGILKLADAGHGIDRRCYRGRVGPGVGQRADGRGGGQVDRGAPAVGLGAEAFGRLADPDHDGRTRTKLVHEAAPGRVRARSAIGKDGHRPERVLAGAGHRGRGRKRRARRRSRDRTGRPVSRRRASPRLAGFPPPGS